MDRATHDSCNSIDADARMNLMKKGRYPKPERPARRVRDTAPRATGLRSVLRLLIVLMLTAAALYGMYYFQGLRDTRQYEDAARDAGPQGSAQTDARVPSSEGLSWSNAMTAMPYSRIRGRGITASSSSPEQTSSLQNASWLGVKTCTATTARSMSS